MNHNINWNELGFGYMQTNSHIVYTFKDNKWDEGILQKDPYLNIHVAATALHYGQTAFEGLKVFTCKNGKICAFRAEENAKRLQRSAYRTLMPEVSTEMFLNALTRVVNDNKEFVPPYGTGGSLYVRPLLIGTGAEIGVSPAIEYKFIIIVMPVGKYYKNGLKGVDCLIQDEYDRAAPQGVGDIKIGGNYAAGLYAQTVAKKRGFPIPLYLDSKEHKYIEEFATSNFIAIDKNNNYITPKTQSILPSITNMSLQVVAEDLGITVDARKVNYEELADFVEVGACGTAVVITPISRIVRNNDEFKYADLTEKSTLTKLYNQLQAIQYGEIEDSHNWLYEIK